MKQLGLALRVAGLCLGLLVFLMAGLHLGWPGVPWLINVALAKLAIIGSAGLMVGGVALERVGQRLEEKRLRSGPAEP